MTLRSRYHDDEAGSRWLDGVPEDVLARCLEPQLECSCGRKHLIHAEVLPRRGLP
jgi:hypothetical protein